MVIEEIAKQSASKLDKEMYKFLKQNGYDLEENNIEQILKLKEQLAKKDRQLRLEHLDDEIYSVNEKRISYKTSYVIFFDSLSHPMSIEEIKVKARGKDD